uniref:Retrovirus-related env polyprotein from transposon gypsy n=1 Tax=Aedes albopictus TaxID=7160 RepID=A0A1W7R5Z2_AEDAL
MIRFHIFILVAIINVRAQKLEIANINEQPLLTLITGKCKIQTGNIKVIHPINLTNIEITVNLLTNVVHQKTNNHLTEIAKYKMKELYSNLVEIKPRNHRERRSLESIGTAWKWVAGNPDAEDLRIINKTMNELITSNNEQYQVNEQLNNRLNTITRTINGIIESKVKNRIILDEMETIIIIMKIDVINKLLEDIAEAVILSKLTVTSNKILSLNEIFIIKKILEEQGIQTDLPDEALNLVQPSVAVNDHTLLYIINVPQMSKEEGSIVRIVPTPKNGQIIKQFPDYLIKIGETLYTTNQPTKYIQRSTYIREYSDNCIQPLIEGKTSKCSTKESSKTKISLLTDGMLLINNALNDLLQSDCGPDDRNLTGNFLISFSNCSIYYRNESFISSTKEITTNILHGAMHNFAMDLQPEDDVLKLINNLTVSNRRKIDHVYLMQYNNKLWDWSLLGGISISTALTITISVFAFIIYRKSLYTILSKLTRKRKPKTPSPGDQPNQDA